MTTPTLERSQTTPCEAALCRLSSSQGGALAGRAQVWGLLFENGCCGIIEVLRPSVNKLRLAGLTHPAFVRRQVPGASQVHCEDAGDPQAEPDAGAQAGHGCGTPWTLAQLKKLWLPLCTYMVQPAPLGGPAPAVLLGTYLKLSALPRTCACRRSMTATTTGCVARVENRLVVAGLERVPARGDAPHPKRA